MAYQWLINGFNPMHELINKATKPYECVFT